MPDPTCISTYPDPSIQNTRWGYGVIIGRKSGRRPDASCGGTTHASLPLVNRVRISMVQPADVPVLHVVLARSIVRIHRREDAVVRHYRMRYRTCVIVTAFVPHTFIGIYAFMSKGQQVAQLVY